MVAKTHLRLVAPTTEKQTVAPDMIRRRPTALSRAPDGGRSRAPDCRRERRPLGPSRQRDDLGRLSLLALIPALTASITSFRISYRSSARRCHSAFSASRLARALALASRIRSLQDLVASTIGLLGWG